MFSKIVLTSLSSLFLASSLYSQNISKNECNKKGENFIYSSNECIEYRVFEGEENKRLNIIVHGTWDEGTNTLGRYAPFAENINMATDITTIAIALPGYSGSSTNNFTSLSHKGVKNLAANKEYILFLGELIKSFKEKYSATQINYIGHSAGAMMGATLTGLKPNLISNIALAGGRYDIHKEDKSENLISMVDVLENINKNTKFLFIYGTKDKISEPKVTKDFYKIAKNKGLNVNLVEVLDASHIDLDMTDTSVEAITEMLEEE